MLNKLKQDEEKDEMNIQNSREFTDFVKDIKKRILSSQYEALKKVNRELIDLYWNMRQFYLEYYQNSKLQQLVGEISWTKNVVIFQKVKNVLEREFYIKSVIKFGWTKDLLINHLESNSYEKFLLNQTNFNKTLPTKYKHQAKFAVKDEYNFDFLELSDNYNEYELEIGLINKIREFLSVMGTDFTFVGNQYKLEIDNEEYFIDLLLYHRRLRALIAIELKIGTFKPEYVGKMSFYLSILNDTVKLPDENPSIGIIIYKEKNRTIVEYALKETNQPIGIATYKLSKDLPQELKEYLPTASEIEKNLVEYLKVLDVK